MINQSFTLDAIESLIRRMMIQSAKTLVIRTKLQIIEQRQQRFERLKLIAAAVQAGLLSMPSNEALGSLQIVRIAPFAHQTDTGDLFAVAKDQRIQIALQRFPDVLTQISRMAAAALVGTVGDGNRQADLLRHLR